MPWNDHQRNNIHIQEKIKIMQHAKQEIVKPFQHSGTRQLFIGSNEQYMHDKSLLIRAFMMHKYLYHDNHSFMHHNY